jgi:hypothetical protein
MGHGRSSAPQKYIIIATAAPFLRSCGAVEDSFTKFTGRRLQFFPLRRQSSARHQPHREKQRASSRTANPGRVLAAVNTTTLASTGRTIGRE